MGERGKRGGRREGKGGLGSEVPGASWTRVVVVGECYN